LACDVDEEIVHAIRDYEMLLQINNDMQNLKIKKPATTMNKIYDNNNSTKIVESPINELFMSCSVDGPEITNIFDDNMNMNESVGIGKKKEIPDDDDENNSCEIGNSSFWIEDYIVDICKEEKIKEKIINNAIQSEKMVRRIFDRNNIHPGLLPNEK
jgi:hypothetical protein